MILEYCPPTSFKGKDIFEMFKKKDVIITFDNVKYFVIDEKICICMKTKEILPISKIYFEIHYVIRDGGRIANRRKWNRNLLVSRKRRRKGDK